MGEKADGSTTIAASAADVMGVITDFEAYPDWSGMKSAKILKKDNQGRGIEVAYEVEAPVVGKASYTLAYKYAANDGGCSWTTKEIEGKIKDIKGEYALEELDEDETNVTYRVEIDLDVPLPGFMKRQGAKQIVSQALSGLKKRVESR